MTGRQQKRRQERRRHHIQTTTRRRLVAAGGLTAGATLALAGTAHAAPLTYTVGTNADSSSGGGCTTPTNNDCSLREAITLANGNAGADTIVFNSNLTGATISLTTGQLSITEAVTIGGPGASQLTLDGGDNARLFQVNPTSAGDPVAISGLTLTNGYVSGASGGAVYNQDADLTIANAVVSESHATSSEQGGGGIFTRSGSLTVNSSTVSGNYAFVGGGIYSDSGTVTVSDSTLSDNYADDYGGALYTSIADLTVLGSTISGNGANEDGGAIYSSFQTSGGSGNPVTIERSTVTDNHAVTDDGGGIWICCGEPGDALTLVDTTVTGNTAATKTGGLQSYGVPSTLQNSIVSGNSSGTDPTTNDVYAEVGYLFDTAFSLVGVPSTYINTTVAGSNLFGVDPQLGTLQDNGGPTYTMEPASTSPVIDCGSDTANAVDQRGVGFPRVVEQPNRTNSTASGANGADMGAVEVAADPLITGTCVNSPPPPPPPGPAPAVNPSPTGQRAAALSKCKKKHKARLKKQRAADALTTDVKKKLNKKFRKCKRRANRLPI